MLERIFSTQQQKHQPARENKATIRREKLTPRTEHGPSSTDRATAGPLRMLSVLPFSNRTQRRISHPLLPDWNSFPPTQGPIQHCTPRAGEDSFCSHFPLLGRRDPHPPELHHSETSVRPISAQLSAPCALCTKEVSRFFPTPTTTTTTFKRKKNLSRFSQAFSPEPRPQTFHATPSSCVVGCWVITMDEYIRAWMQLLRPRLTFPPGRDDGARLHGKDVSPELFPSGPAQFCSLVVRGCEVQERIGKDTPKDKHT